MKIPSKYCNILECLAYEKTMLMDLLSFMVKDGVDIKSNNYKILFEEYKKASIKYELGKKEFAKIFNIQNKKWRLDFSSQEVIFFDENK